MRTHQSIPLLTLVLFAAAPVSARADLNTTGAVLITWGDTIKHVGDAPGAKVGFRYSYWGIFWLDLWTWGGEFCIYDGDRYKPISEAEAERLLNHTPSKPIFYTFPPGLLIFGPLIAIGLFAQLHESRQAAKMQRLYADPRYQEALAVVSAELKKRGDSSSTEAQQATGTPPFDAGVQHLVALGIERAEAERNLAKLVNTIAKKSSSNQAGG
jgi:hypothetical protein